MWRKRIPVTYDPGSDATLALWIDATDSSTSSLLAVGGGSISNGASIGTAKSKAGTTRSFTVWGGSPPPTWIASGIGGQGVIRSNVQVLVTQVSMSEFNSMAGATVLAVHKVNTQRSASAGLDCIFNSTQADSIGGSHFRSQIYVASRSDAINRVGGRRLIGDAFQYVTSTSIPPAAGSVVAGAFDWAHQTCSAYERFRDGVRTPFQTSGNTEATEPFAMSIGGVAIEAGTTYGDSCNSDISQILMWKRCLTPEEIFPVLHWARRKWLID